MINRGIKIISKSIIYQSKDIQKKLLLITHLIDEPLIFYPFSKIISNSIHMIQKNKLQS